MGQGRSGSQSHFTLPLGQPSPGSFQRGSPALHGDKQMSPEQPRAHRKPVEEISSPRQENCVPSVSKAKFIIWEVEPVFWW